MAEGATDVGIAKRLDLSERPVERHVAHILMKLDLAAARTTAGAFSPSSPTCPMSTVLNLPMPRRHAERPAPEPSGRFWRRHCCGLTS